MLLELLGTVAVLTYTEQCRQACKRLCHWLEGVRTIESEETTARSSLAAAEKQIEHLTVVSAHSSCLLQHKTFRIISTLLFCCSETVTVQIRVVNYMFLIFLVIFCMVRLHH